MNGAFARHEIDQHAEHLTAMPSWGEHAVHEPFEYQESREILGGLVLDHFPACDHHQHGDEVVSRISGMAMPSTPRA